MNASSRSCVTRSSRRNMCLLWSSRRICQTICQNAATAIFTAAFRTHRSVFHQILDLDVFACLKTILLLFTESDRYVSEIIAEKRSKVLFLSETLLRTFFREEPQAAKNYIVFLSAESASWTPASIILPPVRQKKGWFHFCYSCRCSHRAILWNCPKNVSFDTIMLSIIIVFFLSRLSRI